MFRTSRTSQPGDRIGLGRSFVFLCLLISFSACAAHAATRVVDQAGGGDHTSIGAAVAAASDGDTILIGAGRYIESIDTPKALVFSGKDPDAVFWERHPDGWYSLEFDNAAYGEVHGIRFTDVGPGLAFSDVAGPSLVTNCRFEGLSFPDVAGAAIYSRDQVIEILDCHFVDCHTTGAGWGPGAVYLYSLVEGGRVAGCTFENC
ncbi:MAG: hypothetical protein GF346_00215, partial [Candidatus Eisenbacteria bacterium]|nr:hypothetical protein [Candidatus Latescibacterota bacterium]MBD3300856.1 hypothetical protein [Candidatus Eisenbacteria bacterium]